MNGLILPGRQVFIVDTHVNLDPSAEELAEITGLAAEQIRIFGLEPKVALLSHSDFGSSDAPSALKMRATLALLRERLPQLEVDGEMQGDCALDEAARKAVLPNSTLQRQRESAGLPELGQRQHRLQPAEIGRRQQRRDRPDSARLCRARSYFDAVGDRAPYRQYDGADRARCQPRTGLGAGRLVRAARLSTSC
jgi:hypothetical protein